MPTKGGIDALIYDKLYEIAPNIDPNIVTAVSNVLIWPILWLLEKKRFLAATVLMVIRCVLDMLDGVIARKYKRTSTFGCIFDHAGDFLYHFLLCFFVYKYLPMDSFLELLGLFACLYAILLTPVVMDNTLIAYLFEAAALYLLFRNT